MVLNNAGRVLGMIAPGHAAPLDNWNQAVVIDNRPGGCGILGTDQMARAPAAGDTWLAASEEFCVLFDPRSGPAAWTAQPGAQGA